MSTPAGIGTSNSAYYSQAADLGSMDQNIEVLGEPKDGKIEVRLTVESSDPSGKITKTRITLKMPIEGTKKTTDNLRTVIKQAVKIQQCMAARVDTLTQKGKSLEEAHLELRGEFSKGTFIKVNVSGFFTGNKFSLEVGKRDYFGSVDWKDARHAPEPGKRLGIFEKKGEKVVGGSDPGASRINRMRGKDALAKLADGIARSHLQAATGSTSGEVSLPDPQAKVSKGGLEKLYASEKELLQTFVPAQQKAITGLTTAINELTTQICDTRDALESLQSRTDSAEPSADPNLARMHARLDDLQGQLKVFSEAKLNLTTAIHGVVKAHRNVELSAALPHAAKGSDPQTALTTARTDAFNAIARCEFLLDGAHVTEVPKPGLLSRSLGATTKDHDDLDAARRHHASRNTTTNPQDLMRAVAAIVTPTSAEATLFYDKIDSAQTRLQTIALNAEDLRVYATALAKLEELTQSGWAALVTLEGAADAIAEAAFPVTPLLALRDPSINANRDDLKAILLPQLTGFATPALNKGKKLFAASKAADGSTSLQEVRQAVIDGLKKLVTQKKKPLEDHLGEQLFAHSVTATPMSNAEVLTKATSIRDNAKLGAAQMQDYKDEHQTRNSSGENPVQSSIAHIQALAQFASLATRADPALAGSDDETTIRNPLQDLIRPTSSGHSDPDEVTIDGIDDGSASVASATASSVSVSALNAPRPTEVSPVIIADHSVLTFLQEQLQSTVGVASKAMRGEDLSLPQLHAPSLPATPSRPPITSSHPPVAPLSPTAAAPTHIPTDLSARTCKVPDGVAPIDLKDLTTLHDFSQIISASGIANSLSDDQLAAVARFNRSESNPAVSTDPETLRLDSNSSFVQFYRADITPNTEVFGNFYDCMSDGGKGVSIQLFNDDVKTNTATPAGSMFDSHPELKTRFTNEGAHTFRMTETAFHMVKLTQLLDKGCISQDTAATFITRLLDADDKGIADNKHPPTASGEGVWQVAKDMKSMPYEHGRTFDEIQWDTTSKSVMRSLVWQKFEQNPELAAKLVSQTGKNFVECLGISSAGGIDTWGISVGADDSRSGNNTLGLIMKFFSAQPQTIKSALSASTMIGDINTHMSRDAKKAICTSFLTTLSDDPDTQQDAIVELLSHSSEDPKPNPVALLLELRDGALAATSTPSNDGADKWFNSFNPDKFAGEGDKKLAHQMRQLVHLYTRTSPADDAV